MPRGSEKEKKYTSELMVVYHKNLWKEGIEDV